MTETKHSCPACHQVWLCTESLCQGQKQVLCLSCYQANNPLSLGEQKRRIKHRALLATAIA